MLTVIRGKVLVCQSCLTLCNPTDCSPPGSSVHGIWFFWIVAFELWCWKRLLRVPWAARRAEQSILKEIHPKYSLEGLMLKLKLQYLSYLIWRADSLEKTLMLGKIEGKRRREWQRMRCLDSITNSMDMSLSKLQEMVWTEEPGMLQSMGWLLPL